MDLVTLLSAAVAVVSASAAAVLGYWQQRRLRTMEQRNLMDQYGASLAWAAFDLQSRLFNILRGHVLDRTPGPGAGFLSSFLSRGTPEEGEYVRRSTVFVLAEYLGWVEMLRRDVQFLDLGRSRVNRDVMVKISEIGSALSQISPDGNELRLFRTHQRAIGELMIHPGGEPGGRRCLGYVEFCARLDTDEEFREWFRQPLDDVDRLADDAGPSFARIEGIQQQLTSLVEVLDPKSVRFPQFRQAFDRSRHPGLSAPEGPGGPGRVGSRPPGLSD